MSLKCKIGLHDYDKYRSEKLVKCSRCDKVHNRHTNRLLMLETKAWMKFEKGEWDENHVEEYINVLWE